MKIAGYLLIIILVLGTVLISVKQPKMHTRVMIYDSQYKIVDENDSPKVETVSSTKEMPTVPVENNLTREQIVFETQNQPEIKTSVKRLEKPKNVTNTTKVKATQNSDIKQEVKQTPKVNQTVTQTVKKPETQTYSFPTTVQNTSQVKVLTAQEEEVAWNIWRSNLQNRIMKDSKLPILPMGTIFKVSFDVDKNGRVSNVQTWSTDPKYTPYAIEFIAPVIRSYQGKSILDFPMGSQRTQTTFTGSWKTSNVAKYTTPDDYHDIEKVVK